MSAKMNQETFQHVVLLYLIGQFPKGGVFSSFRLQKVLYYAARDAELKPFTFCYTQYGQYSRDAAATLTLMLESDLLKRAELRKGKKGGVRWQLGDAVDFAEVEDFMEKALRDLAEKIPQSVEEYGYLKQAELSARAHDDPDLKERGQVLFEESSPDLLPPTPDEDMEIILSSGVHLALEELAEVIADTESAGGEERSLG